jgi:serine protease inhibitor
MSMNTCFALVSAMLFTMNASADPAADSAAVVRGNSSFAIELYRLQSGNRGNIFFSPYSISTAMALTGAGARGTTAAEIEKAMHFPLSGARLTRAWMDVQSDVNRSRKDVTLMTANALWAAKDVEFQPQYLALARDDFAAKLATVDFTDPEAARQRINSWVSEATKEKIPQLIASGLLQPKTRLVLTNAIYMKGEWLNKFPAGATNQNGRFRTPAGEKKTALMGNRDDFRFARSGGVRIIELPYLGSELSMLAVLPDAVDGLPQVEQSLTVEKLAQWDAALQMKLVDVTFPRFSTDLSMRLGSVLQNMGIRQAFSDHADFSGIAREPLKISEVIHQARIDVTEEGTEAAAATAVIMPRASGIPMTPPKAEVFNADHPFLFLIRQNDTKSILFIGRLVQP